MRVYRRDKKAEREVEARKSKLAILESYLCEKYRYAISDRSVLHVEPRVEKVPVRDHNSRSKIGSATKTESVPDFMKSTVDNVMSYALQHGIKELTRICVKRDLETYLQQSYSDLLAESNRQKIDFSLPAQWRPIIMRRGPKVSSKLIEWRELVTAQRDAYDRVEQTVAGLLLDNYSNDEIVEALKKDEKTAEIFTFYTADQVSAIINNIRELLHPSKEKKYSHEELGRAIALADVQAQIEFNIHSQRKMKGQKQRKRLGLPIEEKKKKSRYTVEVSE